MKPFEQCCRDLMAQTGTVGMEYRPYRDDACRVADAAERLYYAVATMLPHVEAYCASLPDDSPQQDALVQFVLDPARAALKKAEGEQ